jgi:hypothetical protein
MPIFAYGGNSDWIAVPRRSDALSILSRIEAIEGPCPSFVLLWSILAGRLLHALTTASGTKPPVAHQLSLAPTIAGTDPGAIDRV